MISKSCINFLRIGGVLVSIFICPILKAESLPKSSYFEPINPYMHPSSFQKKLYHKFIDYEYTDIWMMVSPSFSNEYTVYISRKYEEGKELKDWEYVVKYKRATKQLAHIKNDFKKIPLNALSASIEPSLAKQYKNLWSSALSKVRYKSLKESLVGLDGTDYSFMSISDSEKSVRYGKIWSPDKANTVPYLMVQSGECLVEYVKSSDEERPSIEEKCRNILGELRSSLH